MGWLIALGIVVLLALLPLGASVSYDSDGPVVKILAGPVKLQVVPAKKKKTKKKKEPKKEKKADSKGTAKKENKKGGSITDFLPLVKLVFQLLGDFRRKLRVNRLEMNLVMGGGDPYNLAMNYGKAWAALGSLWPLLEEYFVIKKRDVEIQCDFEASETLITARLDLTITLGSLIALVFVYGFKAVKELINIMNKRKGGAAT